MSITVADLMSSPPVMIDAGERLSKAAKLMRDENVGVVGVAEGGRLAGVLTDRDIVTRAIAEERDAKAVPAGALASVEVVVVPAGCGLDDAERLMAERRIRRLFVGSVQEPVGVISIDDIVRSRDRDSVQGRQLEVHEEGLLRGYQGHTGQGE